MEAKTIQRSEAKHGRYGHHLVWDDGTVSYMPDEATAKAYAAAPALAEALRDMADEYAREALSQFMARNEPGEFKPDEWPTLSKARAALADAGL